MLQQAPAASNSDHNLLKGAEEKAGRTEHPTPGGITFLLLELRFI